MIPYANPALMPPYANPSRVRCLMISGTACGAEHRLPAALRIGDFHGPAGVDVRRARLRLRVYRYTMRGVWANVLLVGRAIDNLWHKGA